MDNTQSARLSSDEVKLLRDLDLSHHLPAQSDYAAIARDGGNRIITHGIGCYVYDTDGNELLDAMAGIWCVALGYGRTELVNAAAKQMSQLPYYNTFFRTTTIPTIKLAAAISNLLADNLNHVFFHSSGSEAADTALRMARQYWALKGKPERNIVISRRAAYHGSTIAGVSLGGIEKMRNQGAPLVPGIEHINQPHWYAEGQGFSKAAFGLARAQELETKILETGSDKVAAFIGEPVQGGGGVVIPPDNYWPEVERICRKYDVLIVADEVICGFGRTGKWFGHQYFEFEPDLVMMAKGISSGYVPISAVAVSDQIFSTLKDAGGPFVHGFTHSGHPVAAAVALENIKLIAKEGLVERVSDEIGPYFSKQWSKLSDHPVVGEARSIGLLAAVDLVRDKDSRARFEPQGRAAALCRDVCWDVGLIVRAIGDAIAVCPPLTISKQEIDEMILKLRIGLDSIATELL